jgi:predicted Zn-dependent protease
VENSRAALGVLAPRGDAFMTLMLQEQGTDPAAAAAAFLRANRLQTLAAGPLRVGDLGAYRAVAPAVTQGRRVGLHLTWIAHRDRIFRITGIAAAHVFDGYVPTFEQTAGSFGTLTADERRSVRVRVLHAVPARDGETLGALAARTDNTWTTAETAAANALADGVRLAAGQLVKVVVARPYVAQR